MSSNVKDGKVELLNTDRQNILPKFTRGADPMSFGGTGAPSAKDIRNMLTKSVEDGTSTIDKSRPDVVERIRAAKEAHDAMRHSRDTTLFELDRTPLDTFALPGKPVHSAMLPNNKKRTNVKVKKLNTVEVSQEEPLPTTEFKEENEFAFLSRAMGTQVVEDENDG